MLDPEVRRRTITPAETERIVPFEILLDRIAEERTAAWVQTRRHLHRHPELSGQEFQTTQFIAERLRSLKIEPVVLGRQVGCIADLTLGKPGVGAPLIAIRADIDALPLQDRKTVEYSSEFAGVTHACGHDVHTTIALAVAETMVRLAEKLTETDTPSVNLRFIFQPAEEIAEGAAWMVEAGALQGVQHILGLHVDPMAQVGRVGIRYGVLTAHVDEVSLVVRGKGGHAARPQHTTDPLLTAATLVTTLYQQISRQTDALHPTVFTIGSIHGGMASNVIPDEIRLEGTLRTTDKAVRTQAIDAIAKLCRGLAEATGNQIEVEFRCPLGAVFNSTTATSACEHSAIQVVGNANVTRIEKPSMGGEDFAVYLEHVPGSQFRLGCAAAPGEWPLLHSPLFDVDERAIEIGARVLTRAALLLGLM